MKITGITLLSRGVCTRADGIGLFISLSEGDGVLQYTPAHSAAATTQQGLARRFSLLWQYPFKGNS